MTVAVGSYANELAFLLRAGDDTLGLTCACPAQMPFV